MVETWNDYEEGSAIERGIPACGNGNDGNQVSTSSRTSINDPTPAQ
jgi:hypothetical protein